MLFVSLLIECDFWVNRVILSDFLIFRCLPVRKNRSLHTAETTVNLTKPNNHPNSALITSILDESEDRGPYYASFLQKRRNVTFLPSEITHFCHRRPMFQMLYNLTQALPTRALGATSERHWRLGASRLYKDDSIRNSLRSALRASDPHSYEASKAVAKKAQKKC